MIDLLRGQTGSSPLPDDHAEDAAWVLAAWNRLGEPVDDEPDPFLGPCHRDSELARGQRACIWLDGAWALAVWDTRERRLTLATDRLARQRLYYGWTSAGLCFATHPDRLTPVPNRSSDLDPSALGVYFQCHYFPPPLTPWRNLHWLFPGSTLELSAPARPDGFSPWPRYELTWLDAGRPPQPTWHHVPCRVRGADDYSPPIFPTILHPDIERGGRRKWGETAADRVLEALDQALDDAGATDGFGALLSGGVDSSLVTARVAARARAHGEKPPRTWCVGYPGHPEDETVHAAAMAAALGVEHTVLSFDDAEALSAARAALAVLPLPYAAGSLVPLAAAASRIHGEASGLWVGDGGDELFGGYRRYGLTHRYGSWIRWLPGRRLTARVLEALPGSWWDALARAGGRLTPDGVRRRGGAAAARAFFRWLGARDAADLHRRIAFRRDGGESILCASAEDRPDGSAWKRGFDAWDAATFLSGTGATSHLMSLDQALYLPGDGLLKLAAAAEAGGVRLLAPLADDGMAMTAHGLGIRLLVDGHGGKKPLRTALARTVDARLFTHPKRGFGAPLARWLASSAWKKWIDATVGETALEAAGLNPVVAGRWRRAAEAGDPEAAARWWSVLAFLAWKNPL